MFRYRLRTLLIVLALGPPVLAGIWWAQDLGNDLFVTIVFSGLVLAVWVGVVLRALVVSNP